MHQTVAVATDMMFFNRTRFLVRIYMHIKFTTVQYVGKHTAGNLSKSLENIKKVYSRCGMYV